ncbi:MAG: hypothetical protein ABJA74_13605 [Lapillicoccus sp.]
MAPSESAAPAEYGTTPTRHRRPTAIEALKLLELAALALIVVMLAAVKIAMNTIVAGIRGEAAPLRVLRPVARHMTVKTEMLYVDDQYRELVSK